MLYLRYCIILFFVFIPTVLKAQSNLPPSLSKGLVMHFSFSEKNREGVQVRSDNDSNLRGTLQGSAQLTRRTLFGDALAIGGHKHPGRLIIPYSPKLALKPPFTLSFWVQLSHFERQDVFTPNKGGINTVYAHAEHGRGFWTRLDGLGRDFRFIASNDTKVNVEPTSSFELFMPYLKPNVAFHYVVRVQPAEGNKSRYQVFVNGLPREQVPNIFTSEGPNNFENYNLPVSIGAFGEKMDWSLLGAIDEVRLYNRAISNEEVLYLANRHESQGVPPFAEVWKPEAVFWGALLGVVSIASIGGWWHFQKKRRSEEDHQRKIQTQEQVHDEEVQRMNMAHELYLQKQKVAAVEEVTALKTSFKQKEKQFEDQQIEVRRLREENFRLRGLVLNLQGTPLTPEGWEEWVFDKIKRVPFAEEPPVLLPDIHTQPIDCLFYYVDQEFKEILNNDQRESMPRKREHWVGVTNRSIDQWKTILKNTKDKRVEGITALNNLVVQIIYGCTFRYFVFCETLPDKKLLSQLLGVNSTYVDTDLQTLYEQFKVPNSQELYNTCNQKHVMSLSVKHKN